MTEIEKAIERFKICLDCDDCLTCSEHDDAIKIAIEILEEKLKGEKINDNITYKFKRYIRIKKINT